MSQPLNETLRQSRKAKGLTQEQLAEMVHVSRQTISNWETGRANPDYEMLKTLSETLETRLTELLGVEEENQPEAPKPTVDPHENEMAPQPVSDPATPARTEKPSRWSAFLLCLITAAVVLLGVGIQRWWQSRPEPPPYPQEWFMEETPAAEGQAHIVISTLETPVKRSQYSTEDDNIWEFDLYVREDNGVAFTIDVVRSYDFLSNGGYLTRTVAGTDFHDGLNRNVVSAGAVRKYDFMDRSHNVILGKGIILEGTDANGNQLTFRCYIPFSMEIKE